MENGDETTHNKCLYRRKVYFALYDNDEYLFVNKMSRVIVWVVS